MKEGTVLEYPTTKTGSVDFNQGDLVYSNSGVATVCASDANAHTLIGIARLASPMDPTPYGDSVYPDYAEVDYGGVYWMKTTASETYVHSTSVSFGADAQTVTTVAGTYAVGVCYLPDGSTVTGASGVKVPVRIWNRSITGLAPLI